MEKKLDGNFTRILQEILNKPWRQHPTKQQFYGPLPPITKTIKVRRTRHAGYCWRSKEELIRDVLPWTPSHGWAKIGRPARTYIQRLRADTGCGPEDLPERIDERERWWERVRYIRTDRVTYIYIYIYICVCVCMCVYVCECVCVYVWECVCVCVCVCVVLICWPF